MAILKPSLILSPTLLSFKAFLISFFTISDVFFISFNISLDKSSSGKSIFASILDKTFSNWDLHFSNFFLWEPNIISIACLLCISVSDEMRSPMLSAFNKSIFPFWNANFVNSPGSAILQFSNLDKVSCISFITAILPCIWNSKRFLLLILWIVLSVATLGFGRAPFVKLFKISRHLSPETLITANPDIPGPLDKA